MYIVFCGYVLFKKQLTVTKSWEIFTKIQSLLEKILSLK